jgi:hypothetical protein
MTISYTNVSLDKPDAALFKLPAKCWISKGKRRQQEIWKTFEHASEED